MPTNAALTSPSPRIAITAQADTATLIAHCLRGDAAAHALFIQRYDTLVRRTVLRQLAAMGDVQPLLSEVDDFCNDIFIRLLGDGCRRLATVRELQCINAWLMVISRNYVLENARKRRRDDLFRKSAPYEPAAEWTHLSTHHATPPDTRAMRREEHEHVRRMLDSLTPREKLAIQLFFFDGLRYAEIAEVTQQNINTVAAQIRRAKVHLRDILVRADDEDDPPASGHFEGGRRHA